MSITARKQFTITCDSTDLDGLSDCISGGDVYEGDPSEWTASGRIFTRGDLQLHLRREGWSVGTTVLCPHHRKGTP